MTILKLKHILRSSFLLLVALVIVSPSAVQVVSAQNADVYKKLQYPFYEPNASLGNTCSGDTFSGGTVTPGKGAPDGAQFPNLDPTAMANAINKWILQENPNSTLKGLGSTIVATGKNSNVSPFLIVAIAKKESSLGDPSVYNVRVGNNSFGRTAVPGQPSFEGNRSWYKWNSVKASVDYTAPENQNAQGGGDMGSFLRQRYGSQIDNGNITALLLIYAPPAENDTALYIKQVEGWINELVTLSGGTPATPGTETPTNECTDPGSGAVAGDAVKTAINYAWPDYREAPYCREKPAYKQAIEAASRAGMYTGGTCNIDGIWIGVDCGAFVTRVMIDSGADPGYNYGGKLSGGAGNTDTQQRYLEEQVRAGKYQKLTGVVGTAQLQPGDIAINSTHTYMYVGSQPGFNGNSASASISFTGTGWRAPMASNAYGFTEFSWYRLVR